MSSTIASPPAAPSVAPAPAPAPAPAHRSRKQLLAGLILVLLVAAAGVFAVPHFRGQEAGPSTVSGPQGAPFTLKRPAGWNVADAAKLGSMPGKPLAVLNRTDGKGLIVVNRRPKAPSSLRGFSQQLDSQLAKRVPDFKRISARTVRVRAGEAFLYTYVRKSKGTVNSVVVVPGKTHTYVLNAVVPTGARAAARQVGAMLASFDTQH